MSQQYTVSARKYRPATFASVVGQKNLTATLKGAVDSGRLAHAYLFCGPRGVGKTSCARIFARTINCQHPTPDGEACGECESCRAIDSGNSFNIVELDAASNNGVEYIRALAEQVAVPPQVGRYRVFIIDEVHMLSSAAFNAFLKTLEEPPSYAIFILATTEKHKVIPTILSRCQIYDFKRITIEDIVDHLDYVAQEEGITADRKALGVIARKADGAMRDALSIFDQVATSTHGNLTYDAVVANLNILDYEYFFRLVDCFAAGNVQEALLLYKDVRDRGFDSLFFINSVAQHVRDLMVAADPRTVTLLEVPADVAERLVAQARALPLKWYYAALKILNDTDLNYRTASNKQLLVELALIRLCQLTQGAQSPFEDSDRQPALRNISEPARAVTTGAHPAAQVAPYATPPVAAPKSATPSRASRPTGRSIGTGTIRLTDRGAASTSSLQRKQEQFSDSDFSQAWNAYIAANPEQHILLSAMRAAMPKRAGQHEFDILVDHPAQQQAFESAMPKLLEFLRTRLNNDYITIKATINPEKEVSKMLPPKEFLQKIVETNPAVADLLKDIDAEIV